MASRISTGEVAAANARTAGAVNGVVLARSISASITERFL
jgi:hypothetical protein